MKNLLAFLATFILVILIACQENKNKSERKDTINGVSNTVGTTEKNGEFDDITIDSQRISSDTYDYRLLYYTNGKQQEVYRLKNQDYSVELKRKYVYSPLSYVCFEVSDLPTGLTWDILYESKSKFFFITDHYDIHAVGDTLDRTTVNFNNKVATIVSGNNGQRYSIKLNKLWPK